MYRDRRADPQARSSRPELGEFGLDPMIHLKSDHFLDKSKTSYDPDNTDSLKIYVFVKYIGQGIADSEILQLGYISEEDDKPNLIAVEPEGKNLALHLCLTLNTKSRKFSNYELDSFLTHTTYIVRNKREKLEHISRQFSHNLAGLAVLFSW